VNWLWHALWICLIVIPATILWLFSVYDIIFRQHKMATWKRIVWLLVVLFIPILGALIYLGIYATGLGGADSSLDRVRSEASISGDEYEAQRARLQSESEPRHW
jgi:hypothetical protein